MNIAEPVFNGLRGPSKIRGAVDVDIAKSALQKAVRRGDFNLAWMMGLRLNEFYDVPNGKPIRSNLLNRLPLITGEDIGMGNLDVVSKVDKMVNEIRELSDSKSDDDLIRVITLMTASKKSRLGSHVNAVYFQAASTPEYYNRLNELKPSVLETFKKIESNPEVSETSLEGFEKEDALLMTRIVWLLKNAECDEEKMATFFYMRHLVNSENKYKVTRGYPKKRNISSEPIFVIWNEMMRSSPEDRKEMVTLLYKQFLNENERNIYLVLGMFVYFFFGDVVSEEIDVDKIIEENGGLDKIKEVAKSMNVEIPDYCVDKHTKKGRGQGKDSVTFAVEGAVVENEAEWMEQWKDLNEIYIDFKKFNPVFSCNLTVSEIINTWFGRKLVEKASKEEIPDKKSSKKKGSKKEKSVNPESEENSVSWEFILSGRITREQREKIMSDDTPRGQILTSKWKKYVYMPMDEEYVYKGPWNIKNCTLKEKEKLRKLKFRFEVLRLMKARVLKGEILMDDQGCVWVKYPTLVNREPSDWIVHSVHDKISDKVIKVVDRASLGVLPMSYYSHESTRIDMYLFGRLNLYCDFLLLYILGVGDTGLYNVLIGELGPFIIDIDDDTTKTEFTDVWSIFGRRPIESVVDLLVKGVKNKKEKIRLYLDRVEQEINKFVEFGDKFGIKVCGEEIGKRIDNVKNVICKN